MTLRVVMMGTGEFALPAFRGLVDGPHEVVGLVTQPDRYAPGQRLHRNPLKELALVHHIPVLQPEKIRTEESLAALRTLQADIFVVAAYGQILPQAVLTMPRLGAINLHASILPAHRGAAPVLYSILAGDHETGVTIFQIVRELDAGDMLGLVKTDILPTETCGELTARLAVLAVPLLDQVLSELEAGTARPVPQDHARATFAPRLAKEVGRIDWRRSAVEIERHIRAMQPWPGPQSTLEIPNRGALKVAISSGLPTDIPTANLPPGQVRDASEGRLTVATGTTALEIHRIRPEGKREMTAAEFLNGRPVDSNCRFV